MIKKIFVTKGVGKGPTELAAFDSALLSAGIANYNLIHLSSIIPDGAEVVVGRPKENTKEFGHRLYVVISEARESRRGKLSCSGLGWIVSGEGKRGLFVEHSGESEKIVKDKIQKTLSSMSKNRGDKFREIKEEIVSIKCTDSPVCALVVAVYKSEPW